ncbi:uncharacterized protein LOC115531588 [Gadus morhua]|uniref:uncharacterized protein LOC115531588 n=1 Tax=Gadus morhua TaxID=8049 RepID=UPI0011B49CB2|nr:uncharacterized protein LOC115531588 [Gadus morhua]
MMLSWETVAVGMTLSLLVFPLQCGLCWLFRKIRGQVTLDLCAPSSPVCHSVEMDVFLGQSALSGPSFLSLPDTSHTPRRDSSPSSLLGSKAFDSGILAFWEAAGLTQAAHGGGGGRGDGGPPHAGALGGWPSCDSLAKLTLSGSPLDTTFDPSPATLTSEPLGPSPSCGGPTRPLRRKKGLTLPRLAPAGPTNATATLGLGPFPVGPLSPAGRPRPKALAQYPSLTNSFLTQSEENLLRSIHTEDPEDMKITSSTSTSTSDSGRYSPRGSSSSSSSSSSSFTNTQSNSCSSWSDGWGSEVKGQGGPWTPASRYRPPSAQSMDSVASTSFPSPSPDHPRSPSATRIGVARGPAGWLLPGWALRGVYPLVAAVLAVCLGCVALYGRAFPRAVLLLWLASVLTAFLSSALLLEPLKVCVQALLYTVLWQPVDPEVEELLSREAVVRRPEVEPGATVRPPWGYGLLQARQEAQKALALRSLMKHCVGQLLFLLLVLLVNYQSSPEEGLGRMLRASTQRALNTAPTGGPNLTSLTWFRLLSVDFTLAHPETGLLVCVSLQLRWSPPQRVAPSLTVHPLLVPPDPGPHLQLALTVLLLTSALLLLAGEMHAMATERAQYIRQGGHWLQLCLASLSIATAILQLQCQSRASGCVQQLRSAADTFVDFHSVALLAARASQLAAVLLTLVLLKLLGAVVAGCRWVLLPRVLASAWRELGAAGLLLLLLLTLGAHGGLVVFSSSTEGFSSLRAARVSAVALLRGRLVLRRLSMAHPVLGPIYTLLLTGDGLWLLARLSGALLIHSYRTVKATQRPVPQDPDMLGPLPALLQGRLLPLHPIGALRGLVGVAGPRPRPRPGGPPPARLGRPAGHVRAGEPHHGGGARPGAQPGGGAGPGQGEEEEQGGEEEEEEEEEEVVEEGGDGGGTEETASGEPREGAGGGATRCRRASVLNPRRPRASLPTCASFDSSPPPGVAPPPPAELRLRVALGRASAVSPPRRRSPLWALHPGGGVHPGPRGLPGGLPPGPSTRRGFPPQEEGLALGELTVVQHGPRGPWGPGRDRGVWPLVRRRPPGARPTQERGDLQGVGRRRSPRQEEGLELRRSREPIDRQEGEPMRNDLVGVTNGRTLYYK